jgi:hypothetical protein
MRSMFRSVLVALVATLAVGAVTAAGASAFSLQWKVNGALLEAGQTQSITASGPVFVMETGLLKITCNKSTGEGVVSGGKPGTSKLTTLTFTECYTASAGCEVRSAGGTFGTIALANLPTTLKVGKRKSKVEVLADNLEPNGGPGGSKEFVTLEFKGTECASAGYTNTPIQGTIAAEIVNLANGEAKLNFPAEELTGNTLKAFNGHGMRWIGESKQKLTGGGKLEGV